MIRTRDFLLYMLSVVFLFIAIGFTINNDLKAELQVASVSEAEFSKIRPTLLKAVALEDEEVSKEDRINHFKEKIKAGEGEDPNKPILVSVFAEQKEEEEVSNNTSLNKVKYCQNKSNIESILMAWQNKTAEVKNTEGVRAVILDGQVVLQLPLNSPYNLENCIKGELIGVTTAGRLIHINDTVLYQNQQNQRLIGYALDGFPIYAETPPEVELDKCGGAIFEGTYGYYLNQSRSTVLNCFSGVPANFQL